MTASTKADSTYRPEIQGVRTIGALLVAVFHIWGGRVSGGVDVFFVISGFLITGSLYKELQRSQTIDVIAFWGRIAKRVAPMAYLVLTVTLLAAVLWLPESRKTSFLEQVFYSAFHLENLKLMMNAVDYLARDEAPSPVQQFWALSVQVQFYAVWPFLLIGTALLARRARRGALVFCLALAGLLLASLAYSIIQTRLDPSPTYFNTLARLWEFALGGLLAVALPHLVLPARLRWAAGWIGLALVVSCGFVIPAKAHYPGYVALWPTLGAALVLLSGGNGLRFGADRLLSARPLVALGDLSFSFYLWHWPVLIFAMLATGRAQLGVRGGLAVIAVALLGAYLSMRWLEQPIQRSSIGREKAWHVHAMGLALVAPIVLAASAWSFVLDKKTDTEQTFSLVDYPGGSELASLEMAMKTTGAPRPTPAAAKSDRPVTSFNGCHQSSRESAVKECVYGRKDNPTKTIALVGGSHAQQWLPAFEILAQTYGWRIVNITKSACALMSNNPFHASCVEWNAHVIDSLAALRPDAVFTTSTRRTRAKGIRREYIPEGTLDQWARLDEKGLKVIALRDNPWLGLKVPECIERNSGDALKCSRKRADILNDEDPALELQVKPKNVDFIDLTDRFCDRTTCYSAIGNLIVYSDGHHITASYVRTLAEPLSDALKHVRPDLFEEAGKSRSTEAK